MAIRKKRFGPKKEHALQKFIATAPDAPQQSQPAKPEPVPKAQDEDSVQITLRMSRADLERLTATAKRQGIARASYIKRAVFLQLAGDEAK
jgi:predicted DNA binding CopG/RHH family protein